MFKVLARRIVGVRTEDMDRRTYHLLVRRVENSLKEATAAVLCVVLTVVLCAMFVMALVTPEPGYYMPNENGVLVDGVPYHYHIEEGCDVCD